MRLSRLLSVLLYLIALHSLLVGVLLVVIPVSALDYFGYHDYQGSFFKIQGGVFHMIMGLIYFLAARDPERNRILVCLTIAAKFAATIFLFAYYIFIGSIWMVAASGAGDLVMGILVLWMFIRLRDSETGC